ncbi:DUF1641 domain-containing protein [Tuberibacillus sp. Marseille-P3662]|uniref:DUF1641 domain-containing protein n=1 Tax=Tuberibacillus sp. Marseille-P3662 TaxID=1965358 RepID=UPI000A1CC957|nr:DUF1641 domain-containing protein [Tuberibacillus sp. Marseille-P3662]
MSETSNQQPSENQAAAQQTSSQVQRDVLDQLLNPEVQQSLTVLIENLPKLTELVTVLTKSYDTVQSLATDDVLKEDFKGGFQEVLDPLQGKAKEVAANAIEAKERAEDSEETIGLFGLLRLLKDPQAQKLFRFAQAYLTIMDEQERKQQ